VRAPIRPPEKADMVVVGAGPAGLAAATLASRAGISVVILDENVRLGGNYYRQSRLASGIPRNIVGASQLAGQALIRRIDPAHASVCTDALVWGVEHDNTLLYSQAGRTGRITAQALILATGAHERVIPFPGWDLPGVMTAGAAQTLLKTQAILPGKRIVIAGTGPFLYPVSTQLASAGAEIQAICELARDRFWPLRIDRPHRHFRIFREALGYLAKMRRHGLRVTMGTTVIEAHGEDKLREVVIAEFDGDAQERRGTRRTIPADTLLTSFGFVPNIQLARQLGCDLRWDRTQMTHFVACDARLRTSQPSVYLAGEIAGIGGHRVAQAEGLLAAVSALEDLGRSLPGDATEEIEQARRSREVGRQFADHMLRSFELPRGTMDIVRPETVVCRCESVSRADIDYFADLWDGSQRAVKQCTRAGMGRCQGRMCGYAVSQLVGRYRTESGNGPSPDPARLPLKPLELSVAAGRAEGP
jgi:NADPH-dependent 2,4-dienoyl-CoA reductase/sulfur reductase-like enzyme